MPDYPAFAEPEGFTRVPRPPGMLFSMLAVLVVVGMVIGMANFLLVAHPVQQRLDADPRIRGVSLTARYASYVNPRTLVLDLHAVEDAAPLDLFRAVFHSAAAFHPSGRRFERVVLARSGEPVFVLEGSVYATLGAQFTADQHADDLLSTLLGRLLRPGGAHVFGSWGGGVSLKQMEDASEAARQWAGSGEMRRDWSVAP